jgi:hypothetical protein
MQARLRCVCHAPLLDLAVHGAVLRSLSHDLLRPDVPGASSWLPWGRRAKADSRKHPISVSATTATPPTTLPFTTLS